MGAVERVLTRANHKKQRPLFIAVRHNWIGDRPCNPQRRVVPHEAGLVLGRVTLGSMCGRATSARSLRTQKPWAHHPGTYMRVLSSADSTTPTHLPLVAESGRRVNGHVEDLSADDPHELGLRVRRPLEMQSPEDAS